MPQLESLRELLNQNYYIALAALFIGSALLYYVNKHYLLRAISKVSGNFSTFWGRVLFNDKLLSQLAMVLPFVFFHSGLKAVVGLPEAAFVVLTRASLVGIVLLSIRCISILLDNLNNVYSTLEVSRNRPIKGIVQVATLLLYGAGLIIAASIIMDRSPLIFLSGLGAMAAVLMLVFRDTILSLVAGIQITSNNFVQVGDWIEMPQFGADGSVIDIALHGVRVQNWDKTITIIPTHKFLENSFKNWRGMEESVGRRVKRSILLDVSAIRFLTEEEIEKLEKFALLREYIQRKKIELSEHNAQFDAGLEVNGRRLTNVGTFRAYVENYLKQHPMVSKELTFLVRQLAPTETGLPLEIYIFINDVRWAFYEAAQADIFDHLLAIIGEFGLRVHQAPTGHDLQRLTSLSAGRAPA